MAPTPYPELNTVLHELVASAQSVLGDNFLAACLQGSFAVGDFDLDSDCDFIIVIHEELSDDDVRTLNAMHERICELDYAWARHLEGSYFPKNLLRDYTQRGKAIWYVDHGYRSLERSAHDNTVVVRCVLREHGIALAGPSLTTLVDPVPVLVLRQDILEQMHAFRQWVVDDPQRIRNRFYQAFAVLNSCRTLRDLYTGTVGSKRAGAEWVKTAMDSAWAELIDRAWVVRRNQALYGQQPADPQDVKRTLEFIEYIRNLSEKYAADNNIRIISST
jgi:hypothetical protein